MYDTVVHCVMQERSFQLKLCRSNCPRSNGTHWMSTLTTPTSPTSTRVTCFTSHESTSGMETRNRNSSV